MSDSTRQDINYFDAPQDNYDLGDISNPSFIALDSTAFSSTIKITHKTNVAGHDLKVAQSNENAVDIDVSHNVNISGQFGLPDENGKRGRADQVITIKGGCSNISVAGTIHCEPTRGHAHVVIGEWMDQDYSLNRNIHLKLTHDGGGSIYYSTGWVMPFSVHGNGAKWLFWESIGLKLYWVAKWMVRLCLRIPKGTKGPSWL